MKNKDFNIDLLLDILNKFKINPKNINLYIEALTHLSYKNENQIDYDNQRLEFLGDAAISWVTCNYLFNKLNDDNKKLSEGEMSLIKSKVISGEFFSELAKEIKIDQLLLIGNGIKKQGISNKILEDAFEAFIGAVYKDQGIKKVFLIIERLIFEKIKNNKIPLEKPPKTLLQELLMSSKGKGSNCIKYHRIEHSDSRKEAQVIVSGITYGKGFGTNFKEAENNAAIDALSKFK